MALQFKKGCAHNNACIVDQHIQPAMSLGHLGKSIGDIVFAGDIKDHGLDIHTLGTPLIGQIVHARHKVTGDEFGTSSSKAAG